MQKQKLNVVLEIYRGKAAPTHVTNTQILDNTLQLINFVHSEVVPYFVSATKDIGTKKKET